jgi:hypothetical protein
MKITRRRRSAGITATAVAAGLVLAVPAHAVPPAPREAPVHNARVAEYLMQTHTGLDAHNARVTEDVGMSPSR